MRFTILFCLVLASGIPAYASNRSECRQGRGSVVRKIRGFEIRISPYPDKSNPDLDECEAEIYDEIIADNRKALKAKDVNRVVSMKQKPTESPEVSEPVWKILMIVLAYLYSGREDQAHHELQTMWPEFDRERMWKLIQETRHDGILCYTRKDAACGPD